MAEPVSTISSGAGLAEKVYKAARWLIDRIEHRSTGAVHIIPMRQWWCAGAVHKTRAMMVEAELVVTNDSNRRLTGITQMFGAMAYGTARSTLILRYCPQMFLSGWEGEAVGSTGARGLRCASAFHPLVSGRSPGTSSYQSLTRNSIRRLRCTRLCCRA
jgi:hypothetical protein